MAISAPLLMLFLNGEEPVFMHKIWYKLEIFSIIGMCLLPKCIKLGSPLRNRCSRQEAAVYLIMIGDITGMWVKHSTWFHHYPVSTQLMLTFFLTVWKLVLLIWCLTCLCTLVGVSPSLLLHTTNRTKIRDTMWPKQLSNSKYI